MENLLSRLSASPCCGELQFGHGCEPWKTFAKTPGAVSQAAKLQFGHGCEPWKTTPGSGRYARLPVLQFGHGCEPWKTKAKLAKAKKVIACFNSATAVSRGKLGVQSRTPRRRVGFNSATAVSRGKPPASEPLKVPWSCFNSATAVSRGKQPTDEFAAKGLLDASIRPRL